MMVLLTKNITWLFAVAVVIPVKDIEVVGLVRDALLHEEEINEETVQNSEEYIRGPKATVLRGSLKDVEQH